ncbi:MAG: FliM/FliN family flagellar motor switch protein, partial [Brucella pseudogrignonensis]
MSKKSKDEDMQHELNEAIEELQEDKPRAAKTGAAKPNLELIMGIPVDVQVVLGGTTMPVANLMKLGRGAVITLDKQIGDPVDIV